MRCVSYRSVVAEIDHIFNHDYDYQGGNNGLTTTTTTTTRKEKKVVHICYSVHDDNDDNDKSKGDEKLIGTSEIS